MKQFYFMSDKIFYRLTLNITFIIRSKRRYDICAIILLKRTSIIMFIPDSNLQVQLTHLNINTIRLKTILY